MAALRGTTVLLCLVLSAPLLAQQNPEPGALFLEGLRLQSTLELGDFAELERAADVLNEQLSAAGAAELEALLRLRLQACSNARLYLQEERNLSDRAAFIAEEVEQAFQDLHDFERTTQSMRDRGALSEEQAEYREYEQQTLRDRAEDSSILRTEAQAELQHARHGKRLRIYAWLASDLQAQHSHVQALRQENQLDAAEAQALDQRLEFLQAEIERVASERSAWQGLIESVQGTQTDLQEACARADELADELESIRRDAEHEIDYLRAKLEDMQREHEHSWRDQQRERELFESRFVLLEERLWSALLDQSSYDLQLDAVPLAEALESLSQRADLTIFLNGEGEALPDISLHADGQTLRSLLDQIAVLSGSSWHATGNAEELAVAIEPARAQILPSGLRWLELGTNSGQASEGSLLGFEFRAWQADGTPLALPDRAELVWIRLDDSLDPEVRSLLAGLSLAGRRRLYLSRAQARGLPGAAAAAEGAGLVYELELIAVDWTADPDAETRREVARTNRTLLRCHFEDVQVRDVVDFLQAVSGLQLVVHPGLDVELALSCDAEESLQRILDRLCRDLDAAWTVWSGAVVLHPADLELGPLPAIPRDARGLPLSAMELGLSVDLREASFDDALVFLSEVVGSTILASPAARAVAARNDGLGFAGQDLRFFDILNHLCLQTGLQWCWQPAWQAWLFVPADAAPPEAQPAHPGMEPPQFRELPLDAYEAPLAELIDNLSEFVDVQLGLAKELADRPVTLKCHGSPWRMLEILAFSQGLVIEKRGEALLLRLPAPQDK